jgi:hypothetical protein
MQRRAKLLVLLATPLVTAVAVTVCLLWFPLWATPLDKRLLGAWEGSGKVSAEFGLDVEPDPEANVSGRKVSGRVTTACTVQAEFKPDGTYTWYEQEQGEGASKGMSVTAWVPQKDGDPARWEIVRAPGNQLTLRIYLGEVVFHFQGEDAFTMEWPESTQASGTVTFHRSGKSKN